jgi:hypothetical protein
MEKHHVTPVHKGGKNGPIVELNPWDHAELHAERFLNGEDNGFHMRFLKHLDYEKQKQVRKKMGELQEEFWKNGTHPFIHTISENGRKSGQIAVETGQIYEFQRNGSESWKSPFYMFDLINQEETWFESQKEFYELFGFKIGHCVRRHIVFNKRFVFRYEWDQDYCYVPSPIPGKTIQVVNTKTDEVHEFSNQKECSTFLGVSEGHVSSCRKNDRLIKQVYRVK